MKTVTIKNNGVVSISDKLLSELKKEGVVYGKHLCCFKEGICKNATTINCPKIADLEKKNISEYDFITDGYQVIEDGKVDDFVVTGCTNFISETKRDHAKKDLLTLKEEKLSLILDYYNVDTIEEVYDVIKHNSRIR